MAKALKKINRIALWLMAIGALNWLLVALMQFDIVETISTALSAPGLGTLIYSLIGVSGVWVGILALQGRVSIK